eukprot:358138_1
MISWRVMQTSSLFNPRSCRLLLSRTCCSVSHLQDRLHHNSLSNPEKFWADTATNIDWIDAPKSSQIFSINQTQPELSRWFPSASLNVCYNALDRHCEKGGRANQTALIYDSPVTARARQFTYEELRDKVMAFAGALYYEKGVRKGDRVVIYMPMVPEAIIAMLACARIGAIHSVVFGGFAARELATRIIDCTPKVVVFASCGIEPSHIVDYKLLLDKALELTPESMRPKDCIVLNRPEHTCELVEGRDTDWHSIIRTTASFRDCVPVESDHPLYIIYTSGTTGKPKGVVRDSGGHSVMLKWTMQNIYDVKPGETTWAASDIGWVVGHSYIVYAPLLHGCTTILYEGKPIGTPDAGAFWRIISKYNVRSLFTAPTAFRAIRREDPEAEFVRKYDLSSLKNLHLAGERLDTSTMMWAERCLKVPVIDHWWQTETGSPVTSRCMGLLSEAGEPVDHLPTVNGSSGKPIPGFDIQMMDRITGKLQTKMECDGDIVLKLPLAPGCLLGLWKNDSMFGKYFEKYPGFYQTYDYGSRDKDGNIFVLSRVDDVINVSGHRLATSDMEEVVSCHKDVAECAVVGIEDSLKGQIPIGFVVLSANSMTSKETLQKEVIQLVRENIGPVACFKDVLIVPHLPKTRSGKILRKQMRAIVDCRPVPPASTIEDPAVLGEIETATRGIAKRQSGRAKL